MIVIPVELGLVISMTYAVSHRPSEGTVTSKLLVQVLMAAMALPGETAMWG
jgi:hypothetical protein